MKPESALLFDIIQKAKPRLEAISEEEASSTTVAGKWSIKQIIGHLIDSASNNHQRFVRVQDASEKVSIAYEQDFWVNVQHYQEERWDDLLSLWYQYNKHLSHVIANIDPSALDRMCDMGYSELKPLTFVVTDYVRHLDHHLKQILSGAAPDKREKWVSA